MRAKEINEDRLFEIRDENDYLILYTAIIENIDVLITGDKDFGLAARPALYGKSFYYFT